jgi:hypothetical protein
MKTMKTRKNRKTRKGGSIKLHKSYVPTLPTIVEEVTELMHNSNFDEKKCKKRIEILTFLYHSELEKNINLLHALKKNGIKTSTLTLKKY